MVKLQIGPYCEKCREMNPIVDYPDRMYINGGHDFVDCGDTIIRCERFDLCSFIAAQTETKILDSIQNKTVVSKEDE